MYACLYSACSCMHVSVCVIMVWWRVAGEDMSKLPSVLICCNCAHWCIQKLFFLRLVLTDLDVRTSVISHLSKNHLITFVLFTYQCYRCHAQDVIWDICLFCMCVHVFAEPEAECYNSRGVGYRGVVGTTLSGVKCLPWNSDFLYDELHVGSMVASPHRGLWEHAYCRFVLWFILLFLLWLALSRFLYLTGRGHLWTWSSDMCCLWLHLAHVSSHMSCLDASWASETFQRGNSMLNQI